MLRHRRTLSTLVVVLTAVALATTPVAGATTGTTGATTGPTGATTGPTAATTGPAGATTGPTGATATQTSAVTVTAVELLSDDVTAETAPPANGTAEFVTDEHVVARGDVAVFTLRLSQTETATVQVGDREEGYRAMVTLRDENDDGRVSFRFDSYVAGTGEAAYTAVGDDSLVSVTVPDPVDGPTPQGTYGLVASAGENVSTGLFDTTELAVRPPRRATVSIWSAPANDSLQTATQIHTAVAHNVTTACGLESADSDSSSESDDSCGPLLTRASEVARGDQLVVKYEGPAAESIVGSQTPTTAGYAADNVTTRFLTAVRSDDRFTFDLREANPESGTQPTNLTERLNVTNTHVVASESNGSYYVVVDSSLVPDSLVGKVLAAETRVNATARNLTDGPERATANVFLTAPIVSFTDAWVGANESQDLAGRTNLAPGTQLMIVAQSAPDTEPAFIRAEAVTVGADGRFTTQFGFGRNDPGEEFTLSVRDPAGTFGTLSEQRVVIRSTTTPTPTPTASPTPTPTATPTPTPTASPTPTPTATPTPTPTASPTPTTETMATETGIPGFGPLVALVALLTLAVLAGVVRRR